MSIMEPPKCQSWNRRFALSGDSLISSDAVIVQTVTAHGRSPNSTQTIWISPPQLVTAHSNSSLSYSKVTTLKAKRCFVSVYSVLTTCSLNWKNRHKFHFQNLSLESWIMYISSLVFSCFPSAKSQKSWTPETALCYFTATANPLWIYRPMLNWEFGISQWNGGKKLGI